MVLTVEDNRKVPPRSWVWAGTRLRIQIHVHNFVNNGGYLKCLPISRKIRKVIVFKISFFFCEGCFVTTKYTQINRKKIHTLIYFHRKCFNCVTKINSRSVQCRGPTSESVALFNINKQIIQHKCYAYLISIYWDWNYITRWSKPIKTYIYSTKELDTTFL